MTDTKDELLYNHIPAVYRRRDITEGEPLRALLSIIEGEYKALEHDIDRLYDNWFIETCDEWVAQYIADLLGIRGLHPGSPGVFSQRAYVANTLAYRRRKGTISVLEQIAMDTTGWHAKAIEFNRLLSATQNLNHLRKANLTSVDLGDPDKLELINGPFEIATHTADVRNMSGSSGKYNIPNIGLFLWRLQSYKVTEKQLHRVPVSDDSKLKCYTFHPLGYDIPLFNKPQTEAKISHLAEEINVPAPIRRIAFSKRRSHYYGSERSLTIYINGKEIDGDMVVGMDLSVWRKPQVNRVAVDVELGRLSFNSDSYFVNKEQPTVLADYNYGFSADIGSGPYSRTDSLAKLGSSNEFYVEVHKDIDTDTLQKAMDKCADHFAGNAKHSAIIRITDSSNYGGNFDFKIPNNRRIVIEAADEQSPFLGVFGKINVNTEGNKGFLVLNGLFIKGCIEIGSNVEVEINNCTILTGKDPEGGNFPAHCYMDAIKAQKNAVNIGVTISKSIVGPIRLPCEINHLTIRDSIVGAPIVDKGHRPAIAANNKYEKDKGYQPDYGPPATIERSTILGSVHLKELSMASEVIFTKPVFAQRLQKGCVRYSYVPAESRVPRRFRCQPDLALKGVNDQNERNNIVARIAPIFASVHCQHPAYVQLGLNCAEEIRTGAEDGSEMGAFCHLKQPQREANLRESFKEYLKFGMKAEIFFTT